MMAKRDLMRAYKELVGDEFATMSELRDKLAEYKIYFPVTAAEEPGEVVVESHLYSRFSYNGLTFFYKSWPEKLESDSYSSFDELLEKNPGVGVNQCDSTILPAVYSVGKASGTLCVLLGSKILAELGSLM